MSVMRQDPTTGEWVIIAPERAGRPRESTETSADRDAGNAAQPHADNCPFCPGNEARTPPELARIPNEDRSGWAVRVVPNAFPVLDQVDGRELGPIPPLFLERPGVGHHEVVVETPSHNETMVSMSERQLRNVLQAFQTRHRALREDHRARYIVIFKNHGSKAGTSLRHSHSQIVATPVPPLRVRHKYEVARAHFDDTGRCLYCDIIEEEVAAGVRVVADRAGFVVIQPFAPQAPFETWIMPRRHRPSFAQVGEADLAALATVLRGVMRTLHEALGDHDFNLIVHSAPCDDEQQPYYLWHVQIVPRVTAIAGFELGSGMCISTVAPEDSARILRSHLA